MERGLPHLNIVYAATARCLAKFYETRNFLPGNFGGPKWWNIFVVPGGRALRPHRAALARGDNGRKLYLKNSRENSDSKFHTCLRAIIIMHYSHRVHIVGAVSYNIASY